MNSVHAVCLHSLTYWRWYVTSGKQNGRRERTFIWIAVWRWRKPLLPSWECGGGGGVLAGFLQLNRQPKCYINAYRQRDTHVRTHLYTQHTTWKSTAHKQMFCLSPCIHAHILRGWLIEGLNLFICVRKKSLMILFFFGLNKDRDHLGVYLLYGWAQLHKHTYYTIGAEGWDVYLSNCNSKLEPRGLISEHLTLCHSACWLWNICLFPDFQPISLRHWVLHHFELYQPTSCSPSLCLSVVVKHWVYN